MISRTLRANPLDNVQPNILGGLLLIAPGFAILFQPGVLKWFHRLAQNVGLPRGAFDVCVVAARQAGFVYDSILQP